MGLRVNTNLISMTAQRNLSVVSSRLEGNFRRLSSGLRIASAGDDPAGFGISERMRSQVRSLSQAARNAQDGASLVQTAEGALNEVNSNLSRMRELAIQAANGTMTDEDRDVIDNEFGALIEEIDRIANTTEFNKLQLLDGTQASLNLQVGIDSGEVITLALSDVSSSALGLEAVGFDVDTQSNASAALAVIDVATASVNQVRGSLGVTQNRLESSIRSILNTRESLASAESRIRDVDVAAETADLTRNTIMQQASVSVLSQANQQPQIALSLLQG
ncbi:flagellin [Engelhardtia mirabilis]|uniref:Flagellin n=1 Tax=Engelhardtia mirabilis TaxID=2528011 RepID=A0A518BSS9_9BACT|nr:Flagellin [Planctomycetes bacterium Pla133]QDV04340.1 Flagellin [Planctomycetes bacterium Pla86]